MSIVAVSTSPVAAVRPGTAQTSADVPERAAHRDEPARRHALVDAVNQALGSADAQGSEGTQAVLGFAHALMHDLHSLDTAAAPGRGNTWGRRNWSDLPQRIDALATAVQAPAGAAPPAAMSGTPANAALAAVASELPRPTNPITMISIAVQLMQVPSSRLIAAYAALRQAIGQEAAPSSTSASPRSELATFLSRLSRQLAPDARDVSPAASALHLTA